MFKMIPTFGYMGVCVNVPITWGIMTVYLGAVYLTKTIRQMREKEEADEREDGETEQAEIMTEA